MLVHVLGPLRVDVDGTAVALGGRRSQIVLATLALTPNWVVPLDRLVDTVWGPAPPASARTQIRICVSQLRRAFAEAGAPTVIETHPNGYRLRVGPGELDASAFNEEVARARLLAAQGAPEEAVTGLRRALARWTGPAMAGLACPPVEAWARQLEESRLRAVEERIRLELGLGRHQDLVGELEQLVCAHPFREHLHGRLMLALHRSGRTAEALAVYRRLRTALIEELGIEPGPELRSLEREILLGVAAAPPPGEPAVRRRTRAGDAVHSSWCPV
ncbi:AfsR/SARP family transcriptional regulator [Kitasatospora sp. NBC_01246]|uniref:AfsR/SARP family transcriptional regulator n=1 Tax=Kitasatospora sp. NBC_01246 TaxID=2903570 RepID=UPI002E33336F|nr:AfsR/SARP family transcriptional regulator [Kitasatospora sp. NBC_01246]